jgi:hypothetical protein
LATVHWMQIKVIVVRKAVMDEKAMRPMNRLGM